MDVLERIAVALEKLVVLSEQDFQFHQQRTAEMIAEVRALNEQVENIDYDPSDDWKKGDDLDG